MLRLLLLTLLQDMASRFTLDSATEFLFGKNVCSLSAGLTYPASSPLSKDVAFENHPANKFAHAFSDAQIATGYRGRFGSAWRLSEFWTDRVKKHMDVCYKFIDPILKEALEKSKMSKENDDEKSDTKEREVKEGDTLLDHLVNYTEGKQCNCWRVILNDMGLFPSRPHRHQGRNSQHHDCWTRYCMHLF